MPYHADGQPLTNEELRAVLTNPALVYDPQASIPNDNMPTADAPSKKKSSGLYTKQFNTAPEHNDGIVARQDQSWETAGLSPGEMYEYMRNNADCECYRCAACLDRLLYEEKANARIEDWNNGVYCDDEELKAERSEWMTPVDLRTKYHRACKQQSENVNDECEPWMDRNEFNEQKNKRMKAIGYRLFDEHGQIIDEVIVGEWQQWVIRSSCDGKIALRPDKTVLDYLHYRLGTDNTATIETIWKPVNEITGEVGHDLGWDDNTRVRTWPTTKHGSRRSLNTDIDYVGGRSIPKTDHFRRKWKDISPEAYVPSQMCTEGRSLREIDRHGRPSMREERQGPSKQPPIGTKPWEVRAQQQEDANEDRTRRE